MERKIKVLIVDDSALVRQILVEILKTAADMEVVGTASDPFVAREKIKETNPDVLTLDVEMPRMDGLTFLANLMRLRPMPVVMVSSMTERGAETTLKALELGAVDFVSKPKVDVAGTLHNFSEEILGKIRIAAGARVLARVAPSAVEVTKHSADAILPANAAARMLRTTNRIVAVGSSTGGTEAIRELLAGLPADSPAIVIAQHIPAAFSAPFARRMDSLCALSVCEPRGRAVHHGRTCLYRARRPAPAGRARRRALSLPAQRRPAGQPALPERRRVVPLGGAAGGTERRGRHPHRHGRRRVARSQGNARRRRAHDRAGRGQQRGLGHARRGREVGCRGRSLATQPGGGRNHAAGGKRRRTAGGENCLRTILTVDDSTSMRQMVRATLQSAGYDVVEAADGQEALEFARGKAVDLVISDVNMPRMDGITLVHELRALPGYRLTPLLLLTTESSQDKKLEGKRAGATGWIVKPFNPAQLLTTLTKLFGNS